MMQEHTFSIKSEDEYEIIAVIKREKVFYAIRVKGDPTDIQYFWILDVPISDLDKVKRGSRFINRKGYIVSPSGIRSRVEAQIEFIEE